MHQIHLKAKSRADMPECFYGSGCTRKDCVYRHPAKTAKPSEDAPVCAPFILGECAFGDNCRNRHPGSEECEKIRQRNSRTVCRFGSACTTRNCLFKHPPKEPCRYGRSCTNINCVFLHPDPNDVPTPMVVQQLPPIAPEDMPITFPKSDALKLRQETEADMQATTLSALKSKVPTIKVADDAWTNDWNRNPGHFVLFTDPVERFIEVNRSSPPGVIDLHYQTVSDVNNVLDAVLDRKIPDFSWEYYDEETKSVWIVTGVGKHTVSKGRLLIFDAVLDHLTSTGRQFKIAKNKEGDYGGFLLNL